VRNSDLLVRAMLILLVQGAAAGTLSRARENTPPPDLPVALTASGSIVSTNGDSLVIRRDDRIQVRFTLDGSSSLPRDLQKGDRITVRYTFPPGGGRYHAAAVTAEAQAMQAGAGEIPAGGASAAGEPPSAGNESPKGMAPRGGAAPDRLRPGMPWTAGEGRLLIVLGILALGIGLRRGWLSASRAKPGLMTPCRWRVALQRRGAEGPRRFERGTAPPRELGQRGAFGLAPRWFVVGRHRSVAFPLGHGALRHAGVSAIWVVGKGGPAYYKRPREPAPGRGRRRRLRPGHARGTAPADSH
jgi:hypothetical protein